MCCKSTSRCSAAVSEGLHLKGAGEVQVFVGGGCKYKLFKLCVSIYIKHMNIFVLFIERSLLLNETTVYEKELNCETTVEN